LLTRAIDSAACQRHAAAADFSDAAIFDTPADADADANTLHDIFSLLPPMFCRHYRRHATPLPPRHISPRHACRLRHYFAADTLLAAITLPLFRH
jgi:hypothetical protein